jgi:hypothetical protein
MTPRDAFCHIAHDYGVERLAHQIGANPDTLQNKSNPNSETHKPTLDDCVKATIFTGDPRIAHAFAALAGGVFVPTTRLANSTVPELYAAVVKLAARFGEIPRSIDEAMKDGRISSTERRHLQTEIFNLIEAAAALGRRIDLDAQPPAAVRAVK